MDALEEVDLDLELVATHGPFTLTKTGAVATGEPTYDEWQAAFEWAQNVEKASPFWIGDLLVYGDKFGEMASQVLDATDYAEQTCKNAKHTCKVIPPERRRPGVPFSHHQEIAAVKAPDEQDAWLEKCEVENLTRDQLRVQIKTVKSAQAGKQVDLWLHVLCNDVEAQEKLASRLRLEGFSVKMTAKDHKED
jgi:hypothetical protein